MYHNNQLIDKVSTVNLWRIEERRRMVRWDYIVSQPYFLVLVKWATVFLPCCFSHRSLSP